MAYQVGTASDNEDLLAKFNTFVTTLIGGGENWTLIADNTTDPFTSYDLLYYWLAPGLSTLDEIYLSGYARKSIASDWYNNIFTGYTGYVAGNTLATQPGYSGHVTMPVWNHNTPYWFVANGQRAIIAVKVESAYYFTYIGKMYPYATPSQYVYPVCIGAAANGDTGDRYSNTGLVNFWKGNRANFKTRAITGSWANYNTAPYSFTTETLRNTNSDSDIAVGYYALLPITILTSGFGIANGNVYGELDGLYYISGYNNAVENTLVVGGVTYVILRDNTRTGLSDYIALRLS